MRACAALDVRAANQVSRAADAGRALAEESALHDVVGHDVACGGVPLELHALTDGVGINAPDVPRCRSANLLRSPSGTVVNDQVATDLRPADGVDARAEWIGGRRRVVDLQVARDNGVQDP